MYTNIWVQKNHTQTSRYDYDNIQKYKTTTKNKQKQ